MTHTKTSSDQFQGSWSKGVFYQPLNSDKAWSDATWQQQVCTLNYYGINRLYIQWTKHNNSNFSQDNYWLLQRLKQLSKQFDIVIGLYAEDAFFNAINEHFNAPYFDRYIAQNEAWLEQFNNLNAIMSIPVDGFYFPGEFNDLVLASAENRQRIINRLSEFSQVVEYPLYISSFYTGEVAPQDYIQALQQLHNAGLAVMHQDGLGVDRVNTTQLTSLRDNLPRQIGVIEELFSVTDDGNTLAQPSDQIVPKLQRQNSTNAFFSLRYLPAVASCTVSSTEP